MTLLQKKFNMRYKVYAWLTLLSTLPFLYSCHIDDSKKTADSAYEKGKQAGYHEGFLAGLEKGKQEGIRQEETKQPKPLIIDILETTLKSGTILFMLFFIVMIIWMTSSKGYRKREVIQIHHDLQATNEEIQLLRMETSKIESTISDLSTEVKETMIGLSPSRFKATQKDIQEK